jgi:nucleoside-diphosphate-sugar epimerase
MPVLEPPPLASKSRVLVTGANGFIGRALLDRLAHDDRYEAVAAIRRPVAGLPDNVRTVQVAALEENGDWGAALAGIDAVVHTAAHTHVMYKTDADAQTAFRRTNVAGTINLLCQAAEAKVSRFVYISSIGVNGNRTIRPFRATDTPNPVEPYAISKHEAEQAIKTFISGSGMNYVIIRPPLVYGPNAPGNFGKLMRCLNTSVPLPLGAIHNTRSLVGLDNLVDLIATCLQHPAAANQTFLAADGEDISTTDLLRRISRALGKSIWLLPIPAKLLIGCARLIGKDDVAQSLCGNLQVDIAQTRTALDWTPPVSLDRGLAIAAKTGRQKS